MLGLQRRLTYVISKKQMMKEKDVENPDLSHSEGWPLCCDT
jgi:hypothetical protein